MIQNKFKIVKIPLVEKYTNFEENKLYIKVGTYLNEETQETIENCILGYFICFSKSPKYRATGCNFDESKDFDNAIVISAENLDKIEVNKSQFVDGKVV